MDTTSFDLEGLQQLHLAYKNVEKNHLKQLDEIEINDTNQAAIELLKVKINNLQGDIQQITQRIDQVNNDRLRFSVEYIFWNFGMLSKSFQVTFVTTSEAYEVFGSYITGIALYEREDMEDLVQRYRDGLWSDGYIRFEDKVSDLTEEQAEILSIKGFLASEIAAISYV
ncbi:MAG TPA: hypothetical protein VF679_08005 [Pedobacter sp.]